jgi:hypothetical protein
MKPHQLAHFNSWFPPHKTTINAAGKDGLAAPSSKDVRWEKSDQTVPILIPATS